MIGEPYILYEVHGVVYGSSSEVAYTSNEGRFVVYGRSVLLRLLRLHLRMRMAKITMELI